jgi:hypothetical protein
MKKRKQLTKATAIPLQNPVAKFAHTFNKSLSFRDKSKYFRNVKHRKQEASSVVLTKITEKAPCFNLAIFCYKSFFKASSLSACQ